MRLYELLKESRQLSLDQRTPKYKLEDVQKKFSTMKGLRLSTPAVRDMENLGFDRNVVIDIIQSMKPEDFDKSDKARFDNRI